MDFDSVHPQMWEDGDMQMLAGIWCGVCWEVGSGGREGG